MARDERSPQEWSAAQRLPGGEPLAVDEKGLTVFVE